MEQYLQECNTQRVHDKTNATGRKGVIIGIRKSLIHKYDMIFKTVEGSKEEDKYIRIEIQKIPDKPFNQLGNLRPDNSKRQKMS